MEGYRKQETPITALSKIFSHTGIADPSRYSKLHSVRNVSDRSFRPIPKDIDESANQEPPSLQNNDWLLTGSYNPYTNDLSKSLKECTNSCSSGYFSSTSHSAPPTCQLLNELSKSVDSKFENLTTEFDMGSSRKRSIVSLRRTQSCTSTWLAKRNHSRESWPRLSGIRRYPSPQPAVYDEIVKNPSLSVRGVSCCPELSTVGEDLDSSCCSESACDIQAFHKSVHDVSCVSNSFNVGSPCAPCAKKIRIASPILQLATSDSPVTNMPEALDATMPLDSSDSVDLSTSPVTGVLGHTAKTLPFDLHRRQSTPMISFKNSELRTKLQHKLPFGLARCASMPAPVDPDRFLSGSDPNLASDGRTPLILPVIERTGAGLNFVSPDTVASLLNGGYEDKRVSFMIVDCRFPYEYEGGHVNTAVNLFTHNDMVQEVFNRVPAQLPPGAGPPKLLGDGLSRRLAIPKSELPLPEFSDHSSTEESDFIVEQDSDLLEEDSEQNQASAVDAPHSVADPLCSRSLQSSVHTSGASARQLQTSGEQSDSSEPRFVVIFHCEFSSQRAPSLATFLRRIDRTTNLDRYPFLFFPELYVMKGGYSEFYKRYPDLCVPSHYITMFNRDFRGELRLYKRLTKRVGSACQNCFRITSGEKEAPAERSSFGRHLTPRKGIQFTDLFDKENTDPRQTCSQSNHCKLLSPVHAFFAMKSSTSLSVSLNAGNTSSSSGDSTTSCNDLEQQRLSCSFEENSVRLAEAVVRIGRRVVAATLSEKPVVESSSCKETDVHYSPSLLAGKKDKLLSAAILDSVPTPLLVPASTCPLVDLGGTPMTPITCGAGRQARVHFSLQGSPNCHPTPVAPWNSRQV